jgi:hypothetical protein
MQKEGNAINGTVHTVKKGLACGTSMQVRWLSYFFFPVRFIRTVRGGKRSNARDMVAWQGMARHGMA